VLATRRIDEPQAAFAGNGKIAGLYAAMEYLGLIRDAGKCVRGQRQDQDARNRTGPKCASSRKA